MKTEKQIRDKISEMKEELKEFKEELRKDPTNKDFQEDVYYIKHKIKHLEWVLN